MRVRLGVLEVSVTLNTRRAYRRQAEQLAALREKDFDSNRAALDVLLGRMNAIESLQNDSIPLDQR